jgi:hypothetical protein
MMIRCGRTSTVLNDDSSDSKEEHVVHFTPIVFHHGLDRQKARRAQIVVSMDGSTSTKATALHDK